MGDNYASGNELEDEFIFDFFREHAAAAKVGNRRLRRGRGARAAGSEENDIQFSVFGGLLTVRLSAKRLLPLCSLERLSLRSTCRCIHQLIRHISNVYL